MEPKARQIHVRNGSGSIQAGENIAQFVRVFPSEAGKRTATQSLFRDLGLRHPPVSYIAKDEVGQI